MRDLRRIWRYLDLYSAKLLPTALVSSRLDFYNSPSYAIDTDLTKLQCIQNRLARLVTNPPSFIRIVPLLRSLHCQWNLECCWRSIRWPTKPCMKSSLFIFTPCLPHHSHPIHWDQTKVLVCWCLGSRPTQVQELFTLVLLLFGTASCCLSAKPFQLLP